MKKINILIFFAAIALCGCEKQERLGHKLWRTYSLVSLKASSNSNLEGSFGGGSFAGIGTVSGNIETKISRRYLFYAKNLRNGDIEFFNIPVEEQPSWEKTTIRYTDKEPYVEIYKYAIKKGDGIYFYDYYPNGWENRDGTHYILYINEGSLDKYINISIQKL